MPSSPKLKTNIFVDDTMFFCSSMGKHHPANLLQQHLNITSKWLYEWRISLNPFKSFAILFGNKITNDVKQL
jgi:hypothetical protein